MKANPQKNTSQIVVVQKHFNGFRHQLEKELNLRGISRKVYLTDNPKEALERVPRVGPCLFITAQGFNNNEPNGDAMGRKVRTQKNVAAKICLLSSRGTENEDIFDKIHDCPAGSNRLPIILSEIDEFRAEHRKKRKSILFTIISAFAPTLRLLLS